MELDPTNLQDWFTFGEEEQNKDKIDLVFVTYHSLPTVSSALDNNALEASMVLLTKRTRWLPSEESGRIWQMYW